MSTKTSNLFTISIIAFIASVGGLLMGFDTGVISGALKFIAATFHLTKQQYVIQEFIVSSVPIGAFVGAVCSSFLTNFIGRRNSIFITGVLFMLGSLITAVAVSVTMVICGRLVMGFAVGLASMAVPMYLSEISPKRERGSIVFIFQLAVTIGLLLAFVINYVFAGDSDWRSMFLVGLVLAVFLTVGIVFLPQSPRWLLQHGKEAKAMKALARIRTPDYVQHELEHIKSTLKAHKGKFTDLLERPFYQLVIITVALFAFQQLTGVNTIFYYAATIFQDAGHQGEHGAILASVFSGVTNVGATIIAVLIIDLMGRRKLLYIGFVGMIVCLLLLGVAYLNVFHTIKTEVTMGSVLAFIFFFAISMGGIPYIIMSEIFPLHLRHAGMAIASCANWGFNIIVSSTFLSLVHAISIGYTFITYGCCTFIGLIFCMLMVPETRGVSLETIEDNLYAGLKTRDIGRHEH